MTQVGNIGGVSVSSSFSSNLIIAAACAIGGTVIFAIIIFTCALSWPKFFPRMPKRGSRWFEPAPGGVIQQVTHSNKALLTAPKIVVDTGSNETSTVDATSNRDSRLSIIENDTVRSSSRLSGDVMDLHGNRISNGSQLSESNVVVGKRVSFDESQLSALATRSNSRLSTHSTSSRVSVGSNGRKKLAKKPKEKESRLSVGSHMS